MYLQVRPWPGLYIFSRPEQPEQVLAANQGNYVKPFTYPPLRMMLGDGLLTAEGTVWRRHRRIIQPVFSSRNVASFAAEMDAAARRAVERWNASQVAEVASEMSALTLDVVGRVLFGTDLVAQAPSLGRALAAGQRLALQGAFLPIPWGPTSARVVQAAARRAGAGSLQQQVERLISRSREQPSARARGLGGTAGGGRDAGGPRGLLELLMAARDADGSGLSEQEIRDEISTFLVAGHETTAMALTWSLALLSAYPQARQRLEDEADAVLGNGPADPDQLPWTTAVISEAMRLYPPAWTIERTAVAGDDVRGTPVPAGSMVAVLPYLIHRNPAVWPNPAGFDPGRFLPGAPGTLPARVVVYYLLAMVLFFQSGYGEVWNKLVAGLDWARRFRARLDLGMQPSPAAITYARQRLGWQVMAALMEAVAGRWPGRSTSGRSLRGCGWWLSTGCAWTCLITRRTGRSSATRVTTAGAARSRRSAWPASVSAGPGRCSARPPRAWAPGSSRWPASCWASCALGTCLLADRNFLGYGLLEEVLAAGVHVLWRAKSDVDLPVLEVLADGTWLSRIADPAASRKMRRRGAGPRDIPGITVRVIEYTVTSEDGSETSETFTLVTDILDPVLLTCEQAAAAYAARWQLETCFAELETSLRGGATVVLRSKSPPMIRQEIYAMLCCYQAIRTLISHAADDAGIDPARISFTRARDAIRSRISDSGCFSP